MSTRPGQVRRALFRLPLLLDRPGLRWIQRGITSAIGIDWIVLETRGRRTGKPHTVVLDVVHSERGTYYVQPAYGRGAQWVRNVTAHPEVKVRIGNRVMRARVRDATGTEGAEIVLRFIRAHPLYSRIIVWFVGYVESTDRPDDELRSLLTSTPVFAIEVEQRLRSVEFGLSGPACRC